MGTSLVKVEAVLLWVLSLSFCDKTFSLGTASTDTLKLVQVIFRHGDRAPTKFYPTDPYINEFDKLWPEGFAQLTNRGKMQQYELGQFLRNRYDRHISKKYSPKELYVISSDMDRTIMSLESNLAGLFPPVVNPWNPEIDWQPIPLRTIPKKEDKFLHNNVKCPRYRDLLNEFRASSEMIKELNEEHEDFIQYCANHSGLDITTVKGLYPLLDILYAQASHNYTLPEWAQGNTLPKLLELHGIVNSWPSYYTDEMKRLWGGPLLQLLVKNMQAVTGDHRSSSHHDEVVVHSVHKGVNRKMLMYSAHDSTLVRIMNTMGIFEPHCPPYASALMIELHQNMSTMDYYIEIHYRNDTTREPYLLSHPKCANPCNLETFVELMNPLIPANWKKECLLEADVPASQTFDNEFFTKKHNSLDAEDDDDEGDISRREDHILLDVFPSETPWNHDHVESSCLLTSSQLLLFALGLIISSAFSTFVIIKVLRHKSEKLILPERHDSYVQSRRRPLCVQFFSSKPIFYRSTYEQL